MAAASPILASLAEIAAQAGQIALETRASGVARELKPDGSIVTAGDRAVETYLRDALPKLVPGSAVWGEEFGHEPAGPGGQWVVDPIDGTSNFAFGSPMWGVSIALVRDAEIIVGAVNLPDLAELYLAERGGGATRNGAALPPIPPGPVRPEELLSCADWLFRSNREIAWPGRLRCSGAFVIDGTFMVGQRYRALVGRGERLYDVAACVLMAQELGAEVCYADGSPFDIAELAKGGKIPAPWLMFPKESGFRIDRPVS